MLINLFLYSVIVAFIVAKFEINIEGKYGWAESLPTWRVKNKITQFFWGEQPYTGYHFWFLMTIIALMHFPIALGLDWSWSKELLAWATFLVASIFEDFFWFVLNPHYGIKKFNQLHAPWHTQWFWRVPLLYIKLGIVSSLLIFFSYQLV